MVEVCRVFTEMAYWKKMIMVLRCRITSGHRYRGGEAYELETKHVRIRLRNNEID